MKWSIYLQQNLTQRNLVDISIQEQYCGVNKVCLYVINLTQNIVLDTVFMHTHCAYSTNNPIYMTLFPRRYTTRGESILVC